MARGLPAKQQEVFVPKSKNHVGLNSPQTIDKSIAKVKAKKRQGLKYFGVILLLLMLILVLLPFLMVDQVVSAAQAKIYASPDNIPTSPVAIILGAGVNKDSTPSLLLAERLQAGVQLYKTDKVQTLLMSGGDVEVIIMRRYAQQHGVAATDIITDNAGLRTYDSCYRASHDLKINKAIVVTQDYHLPRSLYLCNSLGINAVGLTAKNDGEDDWNSFREFFAQIEAWTDVNIREPKPQADK